MRSLYFGILLLTMTLSPAICRAEKLPENQNFNAMYNSTLIVTNDNKTGTTDFCTYTCNDGARFFADSPTDYKIAVFLDGAGYNVETTTIQNLDSLSFTYYPAVSKDILVKVKKGDGEWTLVTVNQKVAGVKTVKLPRVDDYKVLVECQDNSNKVYILEMRYNYIDLSDCPSCFIYKPE